MLYELFTPFKHLISFFNLFEYITFRAATASILALFISFIIGPWVIHILHKNQIGEEIRSTGPESHMKKRGTPTMGGVIILMAVLLPTLLLSKLNSPLVQIIIFSTVWMGLIGFIDDYLKVVKKIERGLFARYKICFAVFSAITYITGRVDYSDYLNILYIPGAGELTIFTSAMAGACIGYLWFNSHPAEIFMGDTGSLSTGAALGTLAILLKKELLLLIIGGVFVWEAISVIIQLSYFRYTKSLNGEGKRFFKMAPIHHHYELKGWPETKVVIRFWIIGLLLALFSLTTFKIR